MSEENVLLCSVGSISDELNSNPSLLQLGYIKESSKMRDVYNAADVYVLPSMADNFPNTIVESLRCGTPVVSFAVGGIPEQITEDNGLLVEERSEQSLAKALDRFFQNQSRYKREIISEDAAKRYAVDDIVSSHVYLYHSICDEPANTGTAN